MRKKTGILLIIVLVLLIAVVGVYFAIAAHYRSHFFRNTTVNGTDVSEMTAQEARGALAEEADAYRLVITGRDEEQEIISGEMISFQYVFGSELEGLLSVQNSISWLWAYLTGAQTFVTETAVSYDEEKLDDAVAALSCMQEEKTTAPENAYVGLMEDGTYGIIAETPGTRVDPEKMYAAVKTAVEGGRKSLNLETADCYEIASVTAEDETLIRQRDLMNQYAAMVINYYLSGDEVESLTGSTFMDWFSLSEEGEPEFDHDAVAAWVDELADRYDTIGTMEPFVTSLGQTISVEAVTYGWQMDRESETEALCELLLAGQTEGRSPIWFCSAVTRGENDVGDTYVEIDYTNQRMWYYKDGVLLAETPVVTGNVSAGNGSPEGMYFISYKVTDAILEGEGYQTPVNYWMPFYGNVGIHDADSWRSSYGGKIYLNSGSHGCINTPTVMASVIYANIEAGTPVICYSSGMDYGYPEQSIAEISADAVNAGTGDLGRFNDYTTETNNINDEDDSDSQNTTDSSEEGVFDIVISDETIWPEGTPGAASDETSGSNIVIID